MQPILLIDDDAELCVLLKDYLTSEGLAAETCSTGTEGLERALSGQWALIILDVMLPDMSGFEVLTQLRARSRIPVLMLTARQEDMERVVGLEMGADDYQTKPFHSRELLARIRAILRRSGAADRRGSEPPRRLVLGDLVIDRGARRVERGGEEIFLTNAEFNILLLLLEAEGQLVSREKISLEALGRALTPFDRSIDVHMSNLRKKLGLPSQGAHCILTVRGSGYLYVLPEGEEPPAYAAALPENCDLSLQEAQSLPGDEEKTEPEPTEPS